MCVEMHLGLLVLELLCGVRVPTPGGPPTFIRHISTHNRLALCLQETAVGPAQIVRSAAGR